MWWPYSFFSSFRVCGVSEPCPSAKHTSLVFQAELFSFSSKIVSSCFLFSPKIVFPEVLAFFSSSSLPLLFYCNSFVLKLFSISAVRNFIVRYFSGRYPGSRPHSVWITHSHVAPPVLRVTFFNSFRTTSFV